MQKTSAALSISSVVIVSNFCATTKFHLPLLLIIGPAGDYLVLDTDYDQFALVYSCGNVGFFKIEFGWLLARTPTVSAEVMAKAKAGFEKYGINFGSFKPTKQDNCNYKL